MKNSINIRNLVKTRLKELDCHQLPAAARQKLEGAVACAVRHEAVHLVNKLVTTQRIAIAFSESIGASKWRPLWLPPKPAE